MSHFSSVRNGSCIQILTVCTPDPPGNERQSRSSLGPSLHQPCTTQCRGRDALRKSADFTFHSYKDNSKTRDQKERNVVPIDFLYPCNSDLHTPVDPTQTEQSRILEALEFSLVVIPSGQDMQRPSWLIHSSSSIVVFRCVLRLT
jgi:hypothetical protein